MAESPIPTRLRSCQWIPHGEDRECHLVKGARYTHFWMCRPCLEDNPECVLVGDRRSGTDRWKG